MILVYALILLVLLVVGFAVVLALWLGWHEKRDATRDEYERWLL